jgi:o-succinylbenzoate synthase
MSPPLRVELVVRDAPLARPVVTARGTWTSRRGVLLALRDGEGRVGRGEATPLPGYSPDDADACARALDVFAPRGDVRAPELAGLPAARFALETALADLEAQRRGTNVASVLAGAPISREIPRAALIELASPALEDEARAHLARGIGTLKAKIGARPLGEDLAALARLRAAVGPQVRLRLDANGAFDVPAAREALAALAAFEPELVEEPTRGEALLALGRCAVPWAADESLQDARIAARLLDSPCAAFVVKPALFGLSAARTLALQARVNQKPVIVTHLFDGPVALAAACELAVSLPDPVLACGLDVHPGLAVWGATPVPQVERAGIVRAYGGVGLGVW